MSIEVNGGNKMKKQNTPFENIDLSIFNIWNPDKTWQELMKITLEDLYKA